MRSFLQQCEYKNVRSFNYAIIVIAKRVTNGVAHKRPVS
jgi:hypothetical protein